MASPDAARIASALSDVASRVAAAAASASASASTTSSVAPRLPRLVAVSKTKPVEALQAAYDAGQRDFGENYVQVLQKVDFGFLNWGRSIPQQNVFPQTSPPPPRHPKKKKELLDKAPALPSDVRWRFIGHLQSNKAAALVKGVPGLECVETVDSLKLATKLDAAVASAASSSASAEETAHRTVPLPVLVQVNTSGEESKHGVEPSSAAVLAQEIKEKCPNLKVAGLMTIGQPDYSSRPENFVCLAQVRAEVAKALGCEPSELELSMGMSGDYEAAIRMGSTNVRVGSTIFGARNYG